MHEQFQELLDALTDRSGVGQEVLGEVLARTSLRAPTETSRVEISNGNPAARRPVDQRLIPQGTVSKAVKALIEVGLLEKGEIHMESPDGRSLIPVRLGRGFAIVGAEVKLQAGQPHEITTALLGLDSTKPLGSRDRRTVTGLGQDSWEQAARTIHDQVITLKQRCDEERQGAGLSPVRMFGLGVQVGAPVQDGVVMPLAGAPSQPPVDFAAMLRQVFSASPGPLGSLPVVVENDVNALAVLAIHEVHYTESDLVVVGVFDEGVGGGLVMDGRVRRGGNGRAMEIGHLEVGYAPGTEPAALSPDEAGKRGRVGGDSSGPRPASAGFSGPCQCGHYGHVDTLATPSRIRAELAISDLQKAGGLTTGDPAYVRAREVFDQSGAALGRALAHVSNTVNPNRVIVYLPAVLAEPQPGTAASAYRAALDAEATGAFGASEQAAYLTVRALPGIMNEVAPLGAKAAAVCVLESFIEHALRLDGCKPRPRRITTNRTAAALNEPYSEEIRASRPESLRPWTVRHDLRSYIPGSERPEPHRTVAGPALARNPAVRLSTRLVRTQDRDLWMLVIAPG